MTGPDVGPDAAGERAGGGSAGGGSVGGRAVPESFGTESVVAEPVEAPRPPRDWRNAVPVVIVMVMIAVGLVLISLAHWRRGSILVGSAVFVAGVMRIFLSEERIGTLAVRSKRFDVGFYFLVAAVLAVVAIGVGVDPVG
ncbi:DUF3017 domain-containing protein [Nakamurella silvestris]|nr:DUF3017 domain-containing protein [Nakamurella silvestris]